MILRIVDKSISRFLIEIEYIQPVKKTEINVMKMTNSILDKENWLDKDELLDTMKFVDDYMFSGSTINAWKFLAALTLAARK